MAHDIDIAEEIARPVAPMDRANGLVAGGFGFGVDRPRDEFAHRIAAANGDSAEFEMRALVKRDFDFQPRIFGGSKDGEDASDS